MLYVFAYNVTPHTSAGGLPVLLVYDRGTSFPFKVDPRIQSSPYNLGQMIIIDHSSYDFVVAHKAVCKYKKYKDRINVKVDGILVGKRVMIFNKQAHVKIKNRKLVWPYFGSK